MSLNLLPSAVPEHIPLVHQDAIALRRVREADAQAIARAVRESRDHLLPWMPWAASDDSCRPEFQAERLRANEEAWARGAEYNFVLASSTSMRVLGCCGLMTRRGPHTLEIGYWTHVDCIGRGYARLAAAALTEIARQVPGVDEVFIVCDAANVRSAAIPRGLGYALQKVQARAPLAPAESGEQMVWVLPGGGSAMR